MAMTQAPKRTESTTPADDFEKRQKIAEKVEQNTKTNPPGATPTKEEKALPQNHPHKGDKPNPDHADGPPAGSGETGGERDGRGEVFDQDRSPKNIDYAGPRDPNTDVFSGTIEDKRNPR